MASGIKTTTKQDAPKRMRMCVNCRAQDAKGTYLRVVRGTDGTVCFDKLGKAPGRGAYACSIDCLKQALSTGKIDRALKVSLSQDARSGIELDAMQSLASKE